MSDAIEQALDRARKAWAAMTPDEQEAMLRAQRESWVRGEMAIGLDAKEAAGRLALLSGVPEDVEALAARPAPEDAGLVERLQEPIIADAFERQAITDGLLAERLLKERIEAADRIEALSAQVVEAKSESQKHIVAPAPDVLVQVEAEDAIARALAACEWAGPFQKTPEWDDLTHREQHRFWLKAKAVTAALRRAQSESQKHIVAPDPLAQVEAEVRNMSGSLYGNGTVMREDVLAIIRRAREGQQ